MTDEDTIQQTVDDTMRKLEHCELDSYSAFAFIRDHALSRFANSTIHQQVASKALYVQIRGIRGDKMLTLNGGGNASDIDQLVQRMANNIDNAPSLPYLQGFIDKQTYTDVNAMGKVLNADERAEFIATAVDVAEDQDNRAKLFGKVETLAFHCGIGNSNGVEGYQAFNFTDYKILSIITDGENRGFGREVRISRDQEVDVESLTQSAVSTSQDTLMAEKLDPATYPVILRPQAAEELIHYSLYGLSSQNFHQGNSAYADKIGEQLFSEKLTIEDRPLDSRTMIAASFDGEGVAKQNQPIIEQGVPKQVIYNTLSASQYLGDKMLTSGHDLLPYSDYIWGGSPGNLVVAPGDSSEQEMIEDMQHGLLIQKFWYSNAVNETQGILTALTRDGLYLVEDGEIKHAVKNLRYTDSFLSFFKDVTIGRTQYSVSGEDTPMLLPTIGLAKLKFTGQSRH